MCCHSNPVSADSKYSGVGNGSNSLEMGQEVSIEYWI